MSVDANFNTALQAACMSGDKAEVRLQLDKGADVGMHE
jgi:ankyrin repeat protein